MNRFFFLKVSVLIAALAMAIYVMSHLSSEMVTKSFENIGIGQAQKISVGRTIGLCRTRIHSFVWPDGRKVEEAAGGLKAKWQATNQTTVDIGPMDVEKWLSLHCEVPATFVNEASGSQASGAGIQPYVTIHYIDGTHEDLDRSDDGRYRFAGRVFTSQALDEAMKSLISLANLNPQPLDP